MKIRLGLNELLFLIIFILFNIFMINTVEGLIAKLFFLYWIISVLGCGAYIILIRDKDEDKKTL